MSKLKEHYDNVVVPNLIKKKQFNNIMSVPNIIKIVINIGFGGSEVNSKSIATIVHELSVISGQKPVITKVRKSIAGFKIRKDYPIGCKVTLRRKIMYRFLDKLLFVVLPRVRDFRGLNIKSFDGQGNYSFGIKEHIVFPEIDYDKIDVIRGMDVTIVTSSLKDEDGKILLQAFNFPFSK